MMMMMMMMMIDDTISSSRGMHQIDPERARFPCSIVWTPLPVLSWLIPFIGHIGICRQDGVILDFAGPNFVCVDHFSFGSVARYIQFNNHHHMVEDEIGIMPTSWDTALQKSTQEYQHLSYNLLTCNCHSFVANSLNRLQLNTGGWNVVNLAAIIFIKGRWVDKSAMVRSLLPFFVVFCLGITIWGSKFLCFLAFITFLLTGWFLLGTYCFKSLIHL